MKSENSSDSEDSIPLGILKSQDTNLYNSLCQHAWEQCEFCDQQFSTRFENIKHNATHIIIPLLKLTLHQCEDCLFHFSSLEDLHSHIIAKNHITSQFPEPKASLTPKLSTAGYQEILQSIVEKQVIVKCQDTLSEVLSPELYKKKSSTNNSPVKETSLDLIAEELNSKVTDINEKSSDIPIYEISSDSDGESPDREHGNPEGEISILGHTPRKQSSPKSEDCTLEKVNFEKQNDPEKQNTPKKQNTLETERSSSFNSSSSKELSSPSQMRDLSSPLEPIKSRIMFEDDYDDDDLFEAEQILPDKPYHPHNTKENSFILGSNSNTPFINNKTSDDYKSFYNTGLAIKSFVDRSQACNGLTKTLNGTQMDNEVNGEVECFTKSVHYDELIVPEICDCRYCGRCFGNRLDLIKHESSHMRARPTRPVLCPVCEHYLAGNYRTLRKHMEKHPLPHRKLQKQRCRVCHLNYYNYRQHARYYHESRCRVCKQLFDNQDFEDHDCNQTHNYKCKTCKKTLDSSQQLNHVCSEPDLLPIDTSKLLKMCELCVAFVRNTQNVHYEVIGEHSEIGSRQQCDSCGNKHFEVCLVKRKVRCQRVTDYKKRKPLSNEERLKKMQKRLKMANKMNKC